MVNFVSQSILRKCVSINKTPEKRIICFIIPVNLVHKQRKKKRCWHVYVYILATKWEGRERVVFIFTKNWVNKKANHLSPEAWMKPGEASAQNSIFFPVLRYIQTGCIAIKMPVARVWKWVILSIVHCGCQSQNNIGFNCCVLITCDQVFFFFSGEGESRPDRQTFIEIWRWHDLKPARARWKSFFPDKLT